MPAAERIRNFTVYQITLAGNLDAGWSTWFDWKKMYYDESKKSTTFIVRIADQAELRGILNNLWDLNKTIINVTQIQDRI